MGLLDRFVRKEKDEDGPEDEPFIDRSGTMDDRNLNLGVSVKNWQTAWRLTFGLLVLSVCFNGYNELKSKYIPLVIAVDQFGQKLYVGPVPEAKPVDNQRAIYREIEDFIEFSRGVSSDPDYERRMLTHVGSRIRAGSQAAKVMADFHAGRPPYETGKRNRITIEKKVTLLQGKNLYSVEWTEVRKNLQGEEISREVWKALLTTAIDPAANGDDADAVKLNPFGFFVEVIDWSRVR